MSFKYLAALLAVLPLAAEMPIVKLTELSKPHDEPHVLECTAGTRLPLQLLLGGEFLSLDAEGPLYLNILKTCYVQVTEDDFFFSADLENWQSFSEFFTGSLGISTTQDNEQPTQAVAQLELNRRPGN